MEETLVTFDIAKFAREIGFDWECNTYYNTFGNPDTYKYYEGDGSGVDINSTCEENDAYNNKVICIAPTQSILQKWLREEHNIILIPDYNVNEFKYFYWIITKDETKECSEYIHKTYEDALEVGFESALKLIII